MSELLHHETRGEGPCPIVILHGFLGSGRNLRSFARRLHEALPESTVFLPDLLGHGSSPGLGSSPSLDTMAKALATWWSAQHIDQAPVLVGHSLGGRVSLAASSAIEAWPLVLLDISPGTSGALRGPLSSLFERFLAAPATAPTRDDMRKTFLDEGIPRPLVEWVILNLESRRQGVGWRVDREALHRLWRRGIDTDLWPALAARQEAGGQTLCIKGGDSDFVSSEAQGRMEALGVEIQTLEGSGHFVHVQALPEVVSSVADFVGRVRA